MGNYWNSLAARERMLISLTGVIVVLLAVYILLLEPRYQRLDQYRTQLPENVETLKWVKQELRSNQHLLKRRNQVKQEESIPLLSLIEQTATQMKLRQSIRRMQPAENNQVKVWLSDIYFDPWVNWVFALSQKGIQAIDVAVNREEGNLVSVRVTFQRSS